MLQPPLIKFGEYVFICKCGSTSHIFGTSREHLILIYNICRTNWKHTHVHLKLYQEASKRVNYCHFLHMYQSHCIYPKFTHYNIMNLFWLVTDYSLLEHMVLVICSELMLCCQYNIHYNTVTYRLNHIITVNSMVEKNLFFDITVYKSYGKEVLTIIKMKCKQLKEISWIDNKCLSNE